MQGTIDFDCVCYGDPLWWIALTAVGTVSDIGADALFYAAELCRIWPVRTEQVPVLALYSGITAARFYAEHARDETDEWRQRMAAAIRFWLEAAAV